MLAGRIRQAQKVRKGGFPDGLLFCDTCEACHRSTFIQGHHILALL
jgi:hypothetical protein